MRKTDKELLAEAYASIHEKKAGTVVMHSFTCGGGWDRARPITDKRAEILELLEDIAEYWNSWGADYTPYLNKIDEYVAQDVAAVSTEESLIFFYKPTAANQAKVAEIWDEYDAVASAADIPGLEQVHKKYNIAPWYPDEN